MSRSRPVRRPPSVRERDAVTEAVPEQGLMDLGQAQLPRRADVLDRRQRRGACPARVARQLDVARAGLDDARGDRPDAARRDELHADPGRRVDRPQVGDELGEVLDRVDVVVRRRADVRHPRLAATKGGDVRRRLPSRQLAALAGLRALGDLDLELVGPGEVRRGDAEAGRRDLLDLRVVALAARRRAVPGRILAPFAGVRRAAGALDADRQRLVGLRREGADRHRRHDEAADDVAGRFDVGKADGGGRCGSVANAEAVADDRARTRAGGREGVAVAGEDRVDLGRVAFGAEERDLARDLRGEEVRLAIGLEPGESGIRQPVRRRVGRRSRPRRRPAGSPARRSVPTRWFRATPARPGSSAGAGPRRARASRTGARRCTRRSC